jgi:hypothetical protein
MANTIRIKRSTSVDVPTTLANAELAFSELTKTLYIGVGTSGANSATIEAIGGLGAFATLATAQTISGVKTFSGATVLGTPGSGTLTNCTGLSLTSGVTGTLPVANGGTGVTTSTGTGSTVLSAAPSFTGDVAVGGNLLLTGGADIRFVETGGGTDYVAFQAPASIATSLTWTLPSIDGSANQLLSTNGSGVLSWASAASAATVTTATDDTNTTRYLLFSTLSGSGKTVYVDDTTGPLSYNPSTGNLSVAGDLDVNGGDIITSAATANLFNANALTLTAGAAATTLTLGYGSTAASTTNISTGAVASATTKTVNIGTGGAASSITNVNLGSANGGTVTVNKDLVVSGDLTVNGTTTTVNSTTLTIDDPNIVLNSIASPTDILADGGGITLKGGAGADYTLTWVNATDSWTSNQNFNISSAALAYYINGTSVLNATTLGTGVITSSLTTVGIIGSGTWQGTAIAGQYGGTGVANTGKTITLGGNLTTSGAFNTTITAVESGTVTLPIGSGYLISRGSTDTLTNKTLTTPKIAQINDTNNLAVLKTAATASAVNEITITNSATTTAPHIGATGTDTNISLHLVPKGSGSVVIQNGPDGTKQIAVGVAGATTGTTTFLNAAQTVNRTLTLPDATDTLVGKATTDTLTNKSISGSTNTISSIANASLTNSSVTIGSTSVSLGATVTTFAGLSSVTSTGFTGALTGNASTATTLATTRAIYGNNFDGSAALTAAIAGTYGGTGVNNGANTITVAGNVSHAGSTFTQTFTATANTSVTLPTSGTLLSDGSSIDGGSYS